MSDLTTGGLMLMAGGVLVAILRKVPETAYGWAKRQVSVCVTIRSTDPSYGWFQSWMASHVSTSLMEVFTRKNEEDKGRTEVGFSPTDGIHWFRYRGRFGSVVVSKEDSGGGQQPIRQFVVRMFLARKQDVQDLVLEAQSFAVPPDDKITVQVGDAKNGYWYVADRVPGRKMDSVFLPGRAHEAVVEDLRAFLDSRGWYQKVGIPYRRGYLLHGPPGNGKTSVICTVASALKMDVGIINLAEAGMDDARLAQLMRAASRHVILLFEDVDAAFRGREKEEASKGITFSGLLNAIEGVSSKEGRILFMTTNHVDRIDPALIRPGRVDYRLFIDNAQPIQAVEFLERFYPGAGGDHKEEVSRIVSSAPMGMSMLQAAMLRHKDDPAAALAYLRTQIPIREAA